jgi:transcriptional regulator with XRE-family HTH domain
MTQQALADAAGIHVSQIRHNETTVAQPSVDAMFKLARGLATTTDSLLFEEQERAPQGDLRLPFEAGETLDADEQRLVRELLDALLLRHRVKGCSS